MISVNKIIKIKNTISKLRKQGKRIAFVPTMGALHAGHISLIRAAKKAGGAVVVSIFVNPLQFGPKEDYKKYPRIIKEDKEILSKEKVDILFIPSALEMYPEGYSTYVTEKNLSKVMCGASRPGHFAGVATVVLKLFNIVKPDIVFFGQKDYQQAAIIKKIIRDLNLDINLVIVPTVREKDGLAMSSRNRYLSNAERTRALGLYKALKTKKLAKKINGIRLDYFVAVDKETLEPVKKIKKGTLLAIAGRVGKTRLIDNVIV